ncbi:MAG: FxsA family protein [Gammaproteobacteria bacterium]|nr:FxsA family protein [Oceanospirillaceae bacterium]NRA73050.1 FxsA family protein [Gammaproteobacteria bacterium]
MPIVFIIFIIIPIIEITLLINVGQLIGAWYTVGLVLLSAFVGVNMLRYQGLATLSRAQQKMARGEMPQQEMIEGLVLAVGGALLITPGFLTDFIGFCCLMPLTRMGFINIAKRRFSSKVASAGLSGVHHHQGYSVDPKNQGDIFEGEYTQEIEGSVLIDDKKPGEADKP